MEHKLICSLIKRAGIFIKNTLLLFIETFVSELALLAAEYVFYYIIRLLQG